MTFKMVMPQTILSLCDGHGSWSQPYVDADYNVIRVDLETTGQDVRMMQFPAGYIHGILAAPPCTVFANSGARWPRTKAEMLEGLSVVDACMRIIHTTKPVWWALENPVGKLTRYLGPATMSFDPNDYGDDYTKRTLLWGTFTQPARTPVPATAGSKMHRLPPGEHRAALRSMTPEGFARAFFEANP